MDEVDRDLAADVENAMLARFDPAAADSTDLYTWISCKLAELKRSRDLVADLERRNLFLLKGLAAETCDCCGLTFAEIIRRGHAVGAALESSGADAILVAKREGR